jgi:hypothetical protein
VWQSAVELAREYGVYSVAHHLRQDYAGLKKRLGGVSHRRRKVSKPAARFRGADIIQSLVHLGHNVEAVEDV